MKLSGLWPSVWNPCPPTLLRSTGRFFASDHRLSSWWRPGLLGPRVLHFWLFSSWTSSIFHWLRSLLFIVPCTSLQTIPLVLAQEVLWLIISPGLCPLSRKPIPLQDGRLTTQSCPQPPTHRPPLLCSQDSSLSPLWLLPSTIPLTGEGLDILRWRWAFCPSNREDSLTV